MKVEQSWADNCIFLALEGTEVVAHKELENFKRWEHGSLTQGSIQLSYLEALNLWSDLFAALQEYDRMEERAQKDMGG